MDQSRESAVDSETAKEFNESRSLVWRSRQPSLLRHEFHMMKPITLRRLNSCSLLLCLILRYVNFARKPFRSHVSLYFRQLLATGSRRVHANGLLLLLGNNCSRSHSLMLGSLDNATTRLEETGAMLSSESESRSTAGCALILDVSQNEFPPFLASKSDE